MSRSMPRCRLPVFRPAHRSSPGRHAQRPAINQFDLYSYASMAVAALQVQEADIAELRRQIASLRAEMTKRRP